MQPRVFEVQEELRPRHALTPPFILLYFFLGLIVGGTVLLALPFADNPQVSTSPLVALFTATSAVTVTGHTVVSTAQHWSYFGQAVIFVLMMVGGLVYMGVATFMLLLIGEKSKLSQQLVLKELMGIDQLGGIRRFITVITSVVLIIYAVGAVIMFPAIREITNFGPLETAWQALFLSVSSFNSAGFSILPEISDARSLAILDDRWALQSVMAVLIIVGGMGWPVLNDIYRKHRFSRLSLDTKLVLSTSIVLWLIGFLAFFMTDFISLTTDSGRDILSRAGDSLFHSISGRTAGFIIADFGAVEDFTKLVFTFLMLIGGGSASVAGGIKVNTLAVIAVAVISSIRARPETEAFGRRLPQTQVSRALTIAVLSFAFIVITVPVLTITEAEGLRSGNLQFLDLFFDTVSAFATNGSSTGIVPELSTISQLVFIGAMLVGRIGPLSLALTLVPRKEVLYRFAEEEVKIG